MRIAHLAALRPAKLIQPARTSLPPACARGRGVESTRRSAAAAAAGAGGMSWLWTFGSGAPSSSLLPYSAAHACMPPCMPLLHAWALLPVPCMLLHLARVGPAADHILELLLLQPAHAVRRQSPAPRPRRAMCWSRSHGAWPPCLWLLGPYLAGPFTPCSESSRLASGFRRPASTLCPTQAPEPVQTLRAERARLPKRGSRQRRDQSGSRAAQRQGMRTPAHRAQLIRGPP